MDINTPARMGRALNLLRPNPIPMWSRSGATEYAFPNILGLTQLFSGEIATVPTYGAPFLDFISILRTTLGLSSPIVTGMARRATITTGFDMASNLHSGRITKSAK